MDRPIAVVRFLDGVVDHLQYRADGRVLDYALRARFAVDYGGETYGGETYGGETYGGHAEAAELWVTRESRGAGDRRAMQLIAPALPGVRFRADDFVPLAEALERIVLRRLDRAFASAPESRPSRIQGLHVDVRELCAELPVEPDA
jgi:hypothetical protein